MIQWQGGTHEFQKRDGYIIYQENLFKLGVEQMRDNKGDFYFFCIIFFIFSIFIWVSDYGKIVLIETKGWGALAIYNFFLGIALLKPNNELCSNYAAVCIYITIFCLIYGFFH